jgi:hypothetical protein
MIEIPGLPPIYQPCPDCPSDADRAAGIDAHVKAYAAFDSAEKAFYIAFFEEFPSAEYSAASRAWRDCDAYGPLYEAKQDTDMASVGCVECDFTGEVLTDTGRGLAEFIRQQMRYPLERIGGRLDSLDSAVDGVAEDLSSTSRRFATLRGRMSDLEYR